MSLDQGMYRAVADERDSLLRTVSRLKEAAEHNERAMNLLAKELVEERDLVNDLVDACEALFDERVNRGDALEKLRVLLKEIEEDGTDVPQADHD